MRRTQSRWITFGVCFALILLLTSDAKSLVETQDTGTWPSDWPKQLDPLRKTSRTIGVHEGNQETIYEIPFTDRQTFEDAWPAILSVRSQPSPLILMRAEDHAAEDLAKLLKSSGAMVRIHAPSSGYSGGDGKNKDELEE